MASGAADQGQRPLDLGTNGIAAGALYPQSSAPTAPPNASTTAAIAVSSSVEMTFKDVLVTPAVTLTQLLQSDQDARQLLFEINENLKEIAFLVEAAIG